MRFKLIVCNFIYFIISLAVILAYVFTPFLSVKVDFTVNARLMETFFGDIEEFKDVDMEEVVGKDGIPVEIGVKITPLDVVATVASNDGETLVKEDFIGKNIDNLVAALEPALTQAVGGVVKSTVKKQTKQQVTAAINDLLSADDDAETYLAAAGLTDEYFDECVDDFYNAFTEENATVSGVSEVIKETVDDALTKLKTSEPEKFAALPDEVSAEDIAAELDETLKTYGLADEDGNIKDVSEALAFLLKKVLSESETETASAATFVAYSTASAETGVPSATTPTDDAEEDLAELIKTTINEKIPADAAIKVALGFKVAAIALLVCFGIWVIFVLVLAFKTFSDNPAVPVKLIFFITGFIQFILGLAIVAVNFAPTILNRIPSISGFFETYGQINVGAYSSMIVACCVLIFNFFFTFHYNHLKRNYKKVLNER